MPALKRETSMPKHIGLYDYRKIVNYRHQTAREPTKKEKKIWKKYLKRKK